jgi:DNA-3-methyladenine glycosylase
MVRRRGRADPRALCAGPGRLCQAMGVTRADDGSDVTRGNGLWVAPGSPAAAVLATPRVGLTVARDQPWRFVEAGSRFLSRAR